MGREQEVKIYQAGTIIGLVALVGLIILLGLSIPTKWKLFTIAVTLVLAGVSACLQIFAYAQKRNRRWDKIERDRQRSRLRGS